MRNNGFWSKVLAAILSAAVVGLSMTVVKLIAASQVNQAAIGALEDRTKESRETLSGIAKDISAIKADIAVIRDRSAREKDIGRR